MPIFGEFETVGEPVSAIWEPGHTSLVWKARRLDGQPGDFAIKCYAPKPRLEEASGLPDNLVPDRGLQFLEGIKQLEQARAEGPQPVLARIYGLAAIYLHLSK